MRRAALALILVGALLVALSGCASTGITAARLEHSVAPTFEGMYRWKQKLRQEPTSKPLDTRANCHRANSSSPEEDGGGEWSCTVVFLIDGPHTRVSFNWNVTVKPDGCWNADGVPPELGKQTLRTPAGKTMIDPIYSVAGCFPAT